MRIVEKKSPNHGARPAGVKPNTIIIHGTAGKSDAGDLSWITSKESQVSYHYLIGRDGTVYRLVPDERRAWHAGKSRWDGKGDVNDFSIGIGLSNRGDGVEMFTDEQYESCAELVAELRVKHAIIWRRVIGHHHISGAHLKVRPDPKSDPWSWFEWMRLV